MDQAALPEGKDTRDDHIRRAVEGRAGAVPCGPFKQSQELALAGVEAVGVDRRPARQGPAVSPVPFETPAPKDIVASSFGFTEKLLASQKDFAEKVVAASEPVFQVTASKKA